MPTDFDAVRPAVPEGRMLSTEEVAKILNVSRPYVVRLADSGKPGAVARAEDGQRRIPAATVDAYRSEQRAKSRDALDELAAISQEAGSTAPTLRRLKVLKPVHIEIFGFRTHKPLVNTAGACGVKEMNAEKPSR